MSNPVHIDTEEEIAEMIDAVSKQRDSAEKHYSRLDAIDHVPAIRLLNELVGTDDNASKISARLLLSVHQKGGIEIDVFDLRHFDLKNQSAALMLIELCANPSTLLDSGLAGILSNDQIESLKNHV